MKIQFVKDSPLFSQTYCIFVTNFTEHDKANVLTTLKSCRATVLSGPDLMSICCKDEATFNWLMLQWQQ